MLRCRELPTGGPRPNLDRRDRAARLPLREPPRLSNGSIECDFYRTVARRLGRDLVAQAAASLAQQVVRGSMLLADWIAALVDDRIPGLKHGR